MKSDINPGDKVVLLPDMQTVLLVGMTVKNRGLGAATDSLCQIGAVVIRHLKVCLSVFVGRGW